MVFLPWRFSFCLHFLPLLSESCPVWNDIVVLGDTASSTSLKISILRADGSIRVCRP